MFVLLVVMGTTVTVRQYTGSVISCDGFKKFGSTFAEVSIFLQILSYEQLLWNLLLSNDGTETGKLEGELTSPNLQDYCWTQGLYTVLEGYDQPNQNIPYPGLLPDEAPPCTPVRLKGKQGLLV